jgi:polyvinyl alcohol dehydrogenase (cytochrome)
MNREASLLLCGVFLFYLDSSVVSAATWPTWGHDLSNSRYQSGETKISTATVASLKVKWSVTTTGDVTATPAVDSQYIYFPDSAGYLYKVSRATGAIVWKFPISTYTGITADWARGTPALTGNVLILGNQSGKLQAPQPARVFAVNTTTGALVWSTQVDSTAMSYVTHSPIVYNGTAYVGTASNEELNAGFQSAAQGWTWHFRGSVVALNVSNGAIKWQSYTVPSGYYGGAIWGSTGAIDPLTNTVYMASGNNYWIPASAQSCVANGGSPALCLAWNDYFDSILALDATTGVIQWGQHALPYDAYNVGCGLNIPGVIQIPPNDNCPNPKGPDYDFGQGPMLFSNGFFGNNVGAGQKSGIFWAFNSPGGLPAWNTQVAPGGAFGGMQWGSAYDGARVYVAVSNAGGTGGTPPSAWKQVNGTTIYSGGWAALNPTTGGLEWTTPDPAGSFAEGPVSVANGVIFGCDISTNGTMFGLNAATGAILWSYNSGGSCNGGASIADGVVYWGSGTGTSTGGPHKVFAFSVNGL